MSDLSAQWRREKVHPCSYAMVAEKNTHFYKYPLTYLDNSTSPFLDGFSYKQALVLDWRIGIDNCTQAKRNSSTFACHNNSVCVDFEENVGGYICNCFEGYEGNPYLSPGCQGWYLSLLLLHDLKNCH